MPSAESAQGSSNSTEHSSETLFANSGFTAKLLPLGQIQNLYRRVQQSSLESWFDSLLLEMRVTAHADPHDLSRVPRSGPVLAVSNHPFGILDAAVLGALLSRLRSDVKIMTNFLLSGVRELQDLCIFVDPFNQKGSAERNRRALKESLLWLKQGHLLAVFPAGEVSHLQLTQARVTDPKWKPMIARLARMADAPVVPVFFPGRNSIAFQALGLMHPRLRTVRLMSEFLHQRGKALHVRIGNVVSSHSIANMQSDEEAIEYLRRRTYLLAQRSHQDSIFRKEIQLPVRKAKQLLAPEAPAEALCADIQGLASEQCVEDSSEFSVYVAPASQIPAILQELGRLREITFREVGEGTGRSRDLDRFDDYYLHAFLWDKQHRKIVGAYRLGIGPEILANRGVGGLYTSTLFRYKPQFFEKLGPAIELGRSFVIPEYQRQFAPLLLLWRGIGRYISEHPETPGLFGAVSISNRYNLVSRELIVRYFESRQGHEMAALVRPRRPFRRFHLGPSECSAVCRSLRDMEDLGDSVSDLEDDGKGMPILFRQYAKLGGKMLAFNVDHKFSNCLDGLVLVDLRQTEASVLERYMGREGLERFRQYHGLSRQGA
jgi:putative hemolysin